MLVQIVGTFIVTPSSMSHLGLKKDFRHFMVKTATITASFQNFRHLHSVLITQNRIFRNGFNLSCRAAALQPILNHFVQKLFYTRFGPKTKRQLLMARMTLNYLQNLQTRFKVSTVRQRQLYVARDLSRPRKYPYSAAIKTKTKAPY